MHVGAQTVIVPIKEALPHASRVPRALGRWRGEPKTAPMSLTFSSQRRGSSLVALAAGQQSKGPSGEAGQANA